MADAWVPIAMAVLRAAVFVYDIVSLPVYLLLHKPWKTLEKSNRIKSKSKTGKPEGPYVNLQPLLPSCDKLKGLTTMCEVFERAVQNNQLRKSMGTREIFNEEDEVQPNGRVFKKYVMGEYLWQSFDRVGYRVKNFAKALNSIGHIPGKNVVLFAETRAEWLIACIACFMSNITVVTLYATLGDDAIVHGINETEATLVITSHDLLPKLKKLQSRIPNVTQIIFMEGIKTVPEDEYPKEVKWTPFQKIEELGESIQENVNLPKAKPSDIAIIMYTSGSTGVPKGVIITHQNLISALHGLSNVIEIDETDVYLAYLPLAHVLELLAEFMCLVHAIPIGYSNPLTISNTSSKIKKGSKGDAVILQPTFMASVPLILDRIFKTVHDAVNDRGGAFTKAFFQFACDYKLYYIAKGFQTPIMNRLVFKKLQNMLGGNLRLMITGGAPLSAETHNFVRVCISCPLVQAYGLTETCACATGMSPDDLSVGRVGMPMQGIEIMLRDWEEGKYHVTDKPYPRGEIIIGGGNVTVGYYKMQDKGDDFFEKDGKRWFYTGDIGEYHPDGCFKIIDRKKDIVKLQFGEYISLGKVEAELNRLGVIDNICIYGDSMKDYVVALVVPNKRALQELGNELGKGHLTMEQMCDDPEINKAVEKMIIEYGSKCKSLQRFELPRRARLCQESWQPDNGLVTAAYKLKRKQIQEYYQSAINEMYS